MLKVVRWDKGLFLMISGWLRLATCSEVEGWHRWEHRRMVLMARPCCRSFVGSEMKSWRICFHCWNCRGIVTRSGVA